MRILYVTTVGVTMGFFKAFIQYLVDNGHTVDIATNEKDSKVPDLYRELNCNIYQISTSRSPLSNGNITAIKQLKKLVEENRYDIVHCHTPVASMCTRLACRKLRKKGTKVFYSAHGFHFYKGAPKKNWLVYYPVEKFCARFTDKLITTNFEDFELAKKKMKAKEVLYVAGVGVDLKRFKNTDVDVAKKRRELGIPEDAPLLLSVGELNRNKNHETVIRAIADMKDVYYVIAGRGPLQEYLQNIIDSLGMTDRVKLLGYRTDIPELCKTADIFCFPSFREGLGISAIEAMSVSKPIVVSDNRGARDFCKDGVNGFVCAPDSPSEFAAAIQKLLDDPSLRDEMGKVNIVEAEPFGHEKIIPRLLEVYGISAE